MLRYFRKAAKRVPALPGTLPDGTPWPKISVITPSYCQGKYIESTILSVIEQEYPNVEHIIVDACSNDNTAAILDKYRPKLAKVIQEPDRGQSDAINKGMRLASGEILTWLNSDDMLAPGSLAAIAMGFHISRADIVCGACQVFNDDRYVYSHLTSCEDGPLSALEVSDLNNYWLQGKFFYQPEAMFSRDIWARSGGYIREDLHWCMDVEMWLRFAANQANVHVITSPVAMFRMHPDQKTSDTKASPTEYIPVANVWRTENGFAPLPETLGEYKDKPQLRVNVIDSTANERRHDIYLERLKLSLKASGATYATSEMELYDVSVQFFPPDKVRVDIPEVGKSSMTASPCIEEFEFYPDCRISARKRVSIGENEFVVGVYPGSLQEMEREDIREKLTSCLESKVIFFDTALCSSGASHLRAEYLRSLDCFIYAGSEEICDAQFLTEAVLSGIPTIVLPKAEMLSKNFPFVYYAPTDTYEWIVDLPEIINNIADRASWLHIHARSYLNLLALWRDFYLHLSKTGLDERLRKNIIYCDRQLEEKSSGFNEKNTIRDLLKKYVPSGLKAMIKKLYY